LVIKRLLDEGPQRYRQLHRALPPSLSDKMLAQVLRELVDHGLVWRQERDPSPPKTVVYGLTALGAGARPVVDALTRWGAQLRPLRGNAEG
ncbi:MAG: helix-turn-helix domain-containing protein, partial [Myxococcota bacterium]